MWNFLYEWLIKSVFLLFVKNIYTKIFNNFNYGGSSCTFTTFPLHLPPARVDASSYLFLCV